MLAMVGRGGVEARILGGEGQACPAGSGGGEQGYTPILMVSSKGGEGRLTGLHTPGSAEEGTPSGDREGYRLGPSRRGKISWTT